MQVLNRRALDRCRRHFTDPPSVGIEVVRRQSEDHLVGQRRGNCGGGLIADWENTIEVTLGERQFLVLHWLPANSLDFGDGLTERLSRHVGSNRGRYHERASVATPVVSRE